MMSARKRLVRPGDPACVAWAVALVLAIALTLMLLERPMAGVLACVDGGRAIAA